MESGINSQDGDHGAINIHGIFCPSLSTRRAQVLQQVISRVHNPPECATAIQLCVGSWSSGIGSSDVMRTLHTRARPVSRQGTIVFDPRVPATPRVPLRCVRYYDAKIRFRSTKTLCRAGSGVAHSGGLCTLGNMDMLQESIAPVAVLNSSVELLSLQHCLTP